MDEKDLKIPQHVAIIMDGNGRWAKKKHRPRTFGHAKGAKVLEQTLEDADSLGVKYFTVYAFSTENWARPYEEVQIIMNLFRDYLISAVDKCNRNNVRCMVIGERTRLDADIIDAINNLQNGYLRIGTNQMLSDLVMPAFLSVFMKEYDKIRIEEGHVALEITALEV